MVGNQTVEPSGGRDASYTKTDMSNIRRVLHNISNSLVDEKDSNGTVSGMSCTSGFTNAALELQQKLKRRKKKKQTKSRRRGDGLPEISEEYDIQTIVSGLTRNSEFPEHRDPPASVDHDPDRSAEWPDDETCGHNGHHVISIMDGNQVMSKDTVRSHQEKPTSQRKEEKRAPLPEPSEMRSETPSPKNTTSKVDKIVRKDPKPVSTKILSPEPDGVKFRNGSQKVAIEPSGMKIETLIYSCALKNENHKKVANEKSRRRAPTVYMNDEDVEVVYQEKDPSVSENSEGRISRRRSRSTNAPKRTRENGHPSKNSNEKRSDPKPESRSRSVDGKRRSRSLPRTLKRITSRYLKEKGTESKRDPSPSKKTPRSTDPRSIVPHSIDPHFIDEIFSAMENKTVSTLGSQCEGIETQSSKRKDLRNVPTNYSKQKFSPYSCEEVFSSHPCEFKCEDPEPRVCVEFAPRQSGGYFHTTSFADKKTTYRETNSKKKRDEGKVSRKYPVKKSEPPDDASNIVFPAFDTEAVRKVPINFGNKGNNDKVQRDAISEEASRNLLLSPNAEENSFEEDGNLFENHESASSHFEFNSDTVNFVREGFDQASVHPTPVHEKELREEFSGHKSSAYIDEPAMTRVAMTPSGRKDLIQRYLALREKDGKVEASFSSGQSVGSAYNIDYTNSIAEKSCRARSNKVWQKSGYDDASAHYRNADSEEWPFSDSFVGENYKRISSFPEQMGGATTPLSSGSTSRIRRSNSVGRNMGGTSENLFSLPNAYKQDTKEMESWSSPSLVSSFPYSQQEKLSYSYASDDDSCASNMFDGYRSNLNSPYAFPAKSNYEEELRPHNQFMKMQIGIGNQ